MNIGTKEIWKPVDGYEGRYEISNFGRVASLHFARGSRRRVLRQSVNTWGYSQVTLSKDKRKKNVVVHRLVAQAFIDNPNDLPQINHIDEDKSNNRADNLEWCDSMYNVNYGKRTEKASNSNKRAVIATLPDGVEEFYESVQSASNAVGVSRSTLSRALNKKYGHNRTCGRAWQYA